MFSINTFPSKDSNFCILWQSYFVASIEFQSCEESDHFQLSIMCSVLENCHIQLASLMAIVNFI